MTCVDKSRDKGKLNKDKEKLKAAKERGGNSAYLSERRKRKSERKGQKSGDKQDTLRRKC